MHATIPKGNIGYDQYTVSDDCSCRTYFCCFPLALANTFPWPFVPILSNFFEKKRTQNHPQCLSGLSRALFPTTFLEIAVYTRLSDLGDLSNLIGSLSRIIQHYSPPGEWIICELGVFPIFSGNDRLYNGFRSFYLFSKVSPGSE